MGGYIVNHYGLRIDRGVVQIVVAGYIIDNYYFRFEIVDHYCLMFNRGVVHIVVAGILLTITL